MNSAPCRWNLDVFCRCSLKFVCKEVSWSKNEMEESKSSSQCHFEKRLFEITHNAAHLGSRRTYQQLSSSYYWYGMRQDIIRWCRQCQHCAKGKGPPLRPHGQLQKIGAPVDLVTMDILSGLPTADDGSKYLLVVVDAFTKWVEAYHYQTKKSRRASQLSTMECFHDSDYHVNCIRTKVETLKANWTQSFVTSQEFTRLEL